jgi:hypothetical protein
MQAISADEIAEIGLKRDMCYGPCPVYSVTLSRTGDARFVGEHFVDLIGEHQAHIDASAFAELASAVVQLGFDSFARNYAIPVTDNATTTTWIVRNGQRLEVEDYGDAGPAELRALVDLIDDAASKLDWRSMFTAAPAGELFAGSSVDDTLRPIGDPDEQHWTQRGNRGR